jgi:pyruvate/2-oxoglutarate dehydrogenase complex dihydrolipoamide acyltransferase (E2) component
MRPSLISLLVVVVTACLADLSAEARSAKAEARSAKAEARQGGPPAGALQPQQTTPLPGTTPQTPSAPPAPAPPPGQNVVAPPPLGRVFASEQGLIFNAIRSDKVTDFETVLAKLRAALANSKDPVRNQQGWGWKIFKAAEPGPNGSVLYVFVMDPAVKGADYGVAKILAEAYPDEITDLYRMYTGAFATAGQTLINLQPVPALGTTPPSSPGVPAANGSTPPPSSTPKP